MKHIDKTTFIYYNLLNINKITLLKKYLVGQRKDLTVIMQIIIFLKVKVV